MGKKCPCDELDINNSRYISLEDTSKRPRRISEDNIIMDPKEIAVTVKF